jgi:hypothetical protein
MGGRITDDTVTDYFVGSMSVCRIADRHVVAYDILTTAS